MDWATSSFSSLTGRKVEAAVSQCFKDVGGEDFVVISDFLVFRDEEVGRAPTTVTAGAMATIDIVPEEALTQSERAPGMGSDEVDGLVYPMDEIIGTVEQFLLVSP